MIKFIGNDFYDGIPNASLKELQEYCLSKDVVSVDIETTRKYKKGTYREDIYKPGLDPYVTNILMIQIGDEEIQFVIDVRAVEKEMLIECLKPILETKKIVKVLHNAKFEGKFFKHCLDIEILNIWDTMICERILYNGFLHSYSLEALMGRYLGTKSISAFNLFVGEEDEEDEVDMYVDKSTRMQFINWGDKPFTVNQIEYGATDIIAPLQIRKIQLKGRTIGQEHWNPKNAFRLENRFTQILSYTELVGMQLDEEKWLEIYEKNLVEYQYREKYLNNYVEENYLNFTNGIGLFSGLPTCAIQWTSSKQVISFFKHLEFCPKEMSKSTKRVEFTVSKVALFKLLTADYKMRFFKSSFPVSIENNEDLILAYLLFKQSEQKVTTFGKEFLKYIHPITGKIHTNYNQFMNTSRLSSRSPNLQNIPGAATFRNCFTDGSSFVNADFSGQETSTLAFVSDNETIKQFVTVGHPDFGKDMHSYAATYMFRALLNQPDLVVTKKSDKEKRNIAKAFNFAIAYGASEWSLKDTVGKSIEETIELIKAYFDGFPGLEDEFKQARRKAVQRGWVQICPLTDKRYFYPYKDKMESILSEIYTLTDYEPMQKIPPEEKDRLRAETNWTKLWREYMYFKGKIERIGLNYRCQGAAATQTKLAAILFYKNKIHPSQHISNMIHDEILAVSSPEYLQDTAKLLQESMEVGGTLVTPTVPMRAEAVISTVWEH